MSKYTVRNVPSVANDPLRSRYIGQTLEQDDKQPIDKLGGLMLTTLPMQGLFFWPEELEAA